METTTQTKTATSENKQVSPLTIWQIDPSHSQANFNVRHMMISKVHGTFEKLSGKLIYNADDPTRSTVEATIDATSINTHDHQRDTHLKSADFFDVENHPKISFVSKRVEKVDDEKLNVVGDLTVRGITKEVTLAVEGPTSEMKDPWGNLRIGSAASTKINRRDFGLHWNAALEAGGFLVGDEITISLDIQFIKTGPQ